MTSAASGGELPHATAVQTAVMDVVRLCIAKGCEDCAKSILHHFDTATDREDAFRAEVAKVAAEMDGGNSYWIHSHRCQAWAKRLRGAAK